MSDFIIAIHGGAENKGHDEIGPEKDAAYRKGLENALQAGWEILVGPRGRGSRLHAIYSGRS